MYSHTTCMAHWHTAVTVPVLSKMFGGNLTLEGSGALLQVGCHLVSHVAAGVVCITGDGYRDDDG